MNKDCETASDQPILQAVICHIIQIIVDNNEEDVPNAVHKCEYFVTSEQQLAGSKEKNERERRIDITAYQSEEFLPLMLASMVQKPIEIKVGQEAGKAKFKKGTEKGRSQVVGHLGKRLEYYFNLGGIGVSSSCIGIVLTTLSIEVIGMDLINVGSKDVDLNLHRTGLVPVQLVKDTPDDIKELLEEEQGEADGFVLLAGALKDEIREDSGTASIKQVYPEEQKLKVVKYLGSGAFSNVVQLGEKEFMKMPKSAALRKSLEGEAKILVALSCCGDNPGIPQPLLAKGQNGIPISTIRIDIGGEISELIGLRLNGVVGLPLHRLPQQMWQKYSGRIVSNVYEALTYAHSKSIYHMDVRPGNIIVKVEKENASVMLSDWGCSVQGGQALKAFRGCTPYAHDRLLGDVGGSFAVDADLDFASLAYTIDHIKHHRLRWMFQFDRPENVCSDDLDLRRDLVREWLEQQDPAQEPSSLGISEEIQESMFAACRLGVCRSLCNKEENPEENAAVLLEDSVASPPTKKYKKGEDKGCGGGK